mmetsp:Transcript_63647/g.74567  ORF Transcript_63647/g.74567 Transcript_63647/m.74567 type:complete len:104 (+) Transcript_63647:720-1031(+)
MPLPQKLSSKEDHCLKTEEVMKRQEEGEVLDSRYFPTCVKKIGKGPCKKGAIADKKLKETYKGIFLAKRVLCVVNCDDCAKPRVVYFLKKPKIVKSMRKLSSR